MNDIISSRTPEGFPNSCPVCRSEIQIEPSGTSGDAPCPKCGTLLWFIETGEGMRYHDAEEVASIREKVLEVIVHRLGVKREQISDSTSFVKDLGADSLDVVELVMGLEELFGETIPDSDAARITTVGELIDFLVRSLKGKK